MKKKKAKELSNVNLFLTIIKLKMKNITIKKAKIKTLFSKVFSLNSSAENVLNTNDK